MLNDAKASPLLQNATSSINIDPKKDAIAKKEDQSFRQEVAQMEQKVAKMLNDGDDVDDGRKKDGCFQPSDADDIKTIFNQDANKPD